ncbi:MAG: glycoside hydrolase family 37 [Phycisphaerae bacterium]|jgi:putative isomerase|nr:glycoside hydrolase family 37 [Phycisphaerae bacterium]
MMSELQQHIHRIRQMVCGDYHGMYRDEGDAFQYPFLTPGSAQYDDVLWDWDSWWSNVALRQILAEVNDPAEYEKARPYERGCILNWIHLSRQSNHRGWIPISCARGGPRPPKAVYNDNMHKPCLAQHAAFLVREDGGDVDWLREGFYPIQCFLNDYRNHHRDRWSGLYYWQNDNAIGVDDDPCTFGRPPRTSASIYLNCLMVKELEAAVYLCERLNLDEVAVEFQEDRDQLAAAMNRHCWDEWLGFYYSVDLSRYEQGGTDDWGSHCGYPRDWPGLIQRINVWSGFLGMWCGVAGREQAQRMVNEHFKDERTFNAPYGVRTLSKLEKMYHLKASGNPSTWRGPIWGVSNYMVWSGLVRYGFRSEATELAEKTIRLFGRDIERFGTLHEYYQPENGEPILNPGFQNWNYLVLNMINWIEGSQPVTEF